MRHPGWYYAICCSPNRPRKQYPSRRRLLHGGRSTNSRRVFPHQHKHGNHARYLRRSNSHRKREAGPLDSEVATSVCFLPRSFSGSIAPPQHCPPVTSFPLHCAPSFFLRRETDSNRFAPKTRSSLTTTRRLLSLTHEDSPVSCSCLVSPARLHTTSGTLCTHHIAQRVKRIPLRLFSSFRDGDLSVH